MLTVIPHQYGTQVDLDLHNDAGTRIKRIAVFEDTQWAFRAVELLNAFGLTEDDADPMEPDYRALAEQEPMTVGAEGRDSAGVV